MKGRMATIGLKLRALTSGLQSSSRQEWLKIVYLTFPEVRDLPRQESESHFDSETPDYWKHDTQLYFERFSVFVVGFMFALSFNWFTTQCKYNLDNVIISIWRCRNKPSQLPLVSRQVIIPNHNNIIWLYIVFWRNSFMPWLETHQILHFPPIPKSKRKLQMSISLDVSSAYMLS